MYFCHKRRCTGSLYPSVHYSIGYNQKLSLIEFLSSSCIHHYLLFQIVL